MSLSVNSSTLASGYASALLNGDLDKVAFRMSRQQLLAREDPPPPRMLFLITETALRYQVGDASVMREQLTRLLSLDSPRIKLQVVPHPMPPVATDGPFCVATLLNRNELAYVETPARGFTLSDTDDIHVITEKLGDIRAEALPVSQSMDVIRKIMEEEWA